MISILAQVENLPIKPFEISEIEGLKGWVITLAFLTLVMIMKEVFKLFSDRKRSKEMELLMNLTVEQKAFNEKIENHFQTIANKYSKNSSDSQILTISKVLFDNASRHLQLFQRKIVEHNHIAGNEEIVKQKIYDEVNNTMNNISSVMDEFCSSKFKVVSEFMNPIWNSKITEMMYRNVTLMKESSAMDDTLERLFKSIKHDYNVNFKDV